MSSKNFRLELEDVVRKSTVVVGNPDTLKPVKNINKDERVIKKFISYQSYIDGLFTKKKAVALQLVTPMPKMRDDIGSSVLQSIYEEMRDSLTLGMFSSAIMHSILLLEYSMRIRVYKERMKSNPNAEWSDIAGVLIKPLAQNLLDFKIIDKDQKADLIKFNEEVRNPYMHINIHELTKHITLDATSINIIKEEIKMMRDLSVTEYPYLWFAGKKKYDAINVIPIMKKCVDYVNTIFDS